MKHHARDRDFAPSRRWSRRGFLLTLGAAAATAACRASGAEGGESSGGGSAAAVRLLPPAELSARLDDVRAGKLAVLHVGPRYLWQHGHVPGSRWVGEAGTDEGLKALGEAVKALPADMEVVAYCGCCPTTHCPNIRPARRLLVGRPKSSFLDLPTNLRTDWTEQGFPVEKG